MMVFLPPVDMDVTQNPVQKCNATVPCSSVANVLKGLTVFQ